MEKIRRQKTESGSPNIRTERHKKNQKRRKFKNFLYLSSDIFLAIAIVAVALLVVLWRTAVMMNYTV